MQPGLFDRPARPSRMTLDERFDAFHRDNPAVYEQLAAQARSAKSKGHSSYSIKTLMELVRWHHTVEIETDEPFKLNNSYASRYARLLMDQEADLADFFETRTLQS